MAGVEVAFTSAGLTTATTAYTSGDMLGTQLTIAGASTGAGVVNYIDGIVLEDDSAVIGQVDFFLFNATVTQAADNAANSWSDADMQKCVGVISIPGPYQSALNRVSVWEGHKPFHCAATSLFIGMVTRSANAVFASGATAIHGFIYFDQT
jgi:hypothetical protein